MTREDAIALATKRADSEGLFQCGVEWAKYYSLDDLREQTKAIDTPGLDLAARGAFWVVRFDDDADLNVRIESGFSIFVYERDGGTEIPVTM